MEIFQKGCTLEFDLGQQVDGYELAGIVLRRVMQRPNKIKTFQQQKERSNSLSPQFGMKSRGWMALRLVYRYLFPSPPTSEYRDKQVSLRGPNIRILAST
jgi:hypothetical protein